MHIMLDNIKSQAIIATKELIDIAKLQKGDLFVIGCSSSEICGDKLGTNSSIETAKAVFEGVYSVLQERGIYLAAQCCEHLNRAVIIEKEIAVNRRYDIVNVVPVPKAGGSFATTAYSNFKNPVAVEYIEADAGIDIGLVMIGMQIRKVAVPVRLSIDKIGDAKILCARSRPKFVGGDRAVYNEDLL